MGSNTFGCIVVCLLIAVGSTIFFKSIVLCLYANTRISAEEEIMGLDLTDTVS